MVGNDPLKLTFMHVGVWRLCCAKCSLQAWRLWLLKKIVFGNKPRFLSTPIATMKRPSDNALKPDGFKRRRPNKVTGNGIGPKLNPEDIQTLRQLQSLFSDFSKPEELNNGEHRDLRFLRDSLTANSSNIAQVFNVLKLFWTGALRGEGFQTRL